MVESSVIRVHHCSLSSAMQTSVDILDLVRSLMLLFKDCLCLPLLYLTSTVRGGLPWKGHCNVLHVQTRKVFDISQLTIAVLDGT